MMRCNIYIKRVTRSNHRLLYIYIILFSFLLCAFSVCPSHRLEQRLLQLEVARVVAHHVQQLSRPRRVGSGRGRSWRSSRRSCGSPRGCRGFNRGCCRRRLRGRRLYKRLALALSLAGFSSYDHDGRCARSYSTRSGCRLNKNRLSKTQIPQIGNFLIWLTYRCCSRCFPCVLLFLLVLLLFLLGFFLRLFRIHRRYKKKGFT